MIYQQNRQLEKETDRKVKNIYILRTSAGRRKQEKANKKRGTDVVEDLLDRRHQTRTRFVGWLHHQMKNVGEEQNKITQRNRRKTFQTRTRAKKRVFFL